MYYLRWLPDVFFYADTEIKDVICLDILFLCLLVFTFLSFTDLFFFLNNIIFIFAVKLCKEHSIEHRTLYKIIKQILVHVLERIESLIALCLKLDWDVPIFRLVCRNWGEVTYLWRCSFLKKHLILLLIYCLYLFPDRHLLNVFINVLFRCLNVVHVITGQK